MSRREPDTPISAERRLAAYQDAMDVARDDLRDARDAEVEAKLARDAARRKWVLAEECPQVGVFDGIRVTVAYRDAWVDQRIETESRSYELAKLARQAAATRLSTLGKNGMFEQSIAASVRESYRGTGRGSL